MNTWALYFIIFFVGGDTIVMENHEKFSTEELCYAEGMIKGSYLLEQTAKMFGVPAQGSFTCQKVSKDV